MSLSEEKKFGDVEGVLYSLIILLYVCSLFACKGCNVDGPGGDQNPIYDIFQRHNIETTFKSDVYALLRSYSTVPRMYVYMYVCMYVWSVCMYVCVCVHSQSSVGIVHRVRSYQIPMSRRQENIT
jgi:hypothetical protein